MTEMLRADLFVEVVEALPPVYPQQGRNFYCVAVRLDECWHSRQREDLGRLHFEITFYRSDDGKCWEFPVDHKGQCYPVDLIVDTIRRLPKLSTVETDFVNMHVSEHCIVFREPEGEVQNTVPLRQAIFYKHSFDNPNGNHPAVAWAIRTGRKEIDD